MGLWLVRLLGLVVVAGLVLGLAAAATCRPGRAPAIPGEACHGIPEHVASGYRETLETIVTLLAGSRLTGGQ